MLVVYYIVFESVNNVKNLELILICRNLKWSVLIGPEHFTTRGLPSCFAAMLFCDDTVSRGRCYGSIVQSREL